MAAIHGKDTKPEIVVRKYLWAHGFRYRLNHRRLPGKPDVVLRKYRTCIFVNGCFWHGHHLPLVEMSGEGLPAALADGGDTGGGPRLENSACCKVPHTNRGFWVRKIMRNKARDIDVQRRLAKMGWHCITVWECQLKPAVREQTLQSLAFTLNEIYLRDRSVHRPSHYAVPEEDMAVAAEEMHRSESGGG